MESAEHETVLLPFRKYPERQSKEHFPLYLVEQGILTKPLEGGLGLLHCFAAIREKEN